MKSNLKLIPLDRIKDPERPLRTNLTPESVDELVYSIKEVGIIQPLVVCESGGGYEVIAGHRRLLASEIAQLVEVPCIIVDPKGMDKEIMKMHENIAREDINAIDWAKHLAYLKSQYKLPNAKIAELLHFSEAWVTQHLQILDYPQEVLEAIEAGTLSFAAARELATIQSEVKRKVYVNAAVRGGVTPAQAANWRREANSTPPPSDAETYIPPTGDDLPLPEPALPLCPVCSSVIPVEEQVVITIHANCAPK